MKRWYSVPMLCKQRSQKEKQGKINRLKRGKFFNFNNAVSTCLKYLFVLLKISISCFHFSQMKMFHLNLPSLQKAEYCSFFPSCSQGTDLHSHQNKECITLLTSKSHFESCGKLSCSTSFQEVSSWATWCWSFLGNTTVLWKENLCG